MSISLAAKLSALLCAAALIQGLPSAASPLPTVPPTGPAAAPPHVLVLRLNGSGRGTVSGRVMLDDGQPAVGFTVRAAIAVWPDGGAGPNTGQTDSHGFYRFTLSPELRGNYSGPGPFQDGRKGYIIWVSNGGKPYVEPLPQIVDTDTMPQHSATNVNFILRLGPQITVHAQNAITGVPVSGLTILYSDQYGSFTMAGVTGSDGSLRFHIPYTRSWLVYSLPGTAIGSGSRHEIMAAPGQEVTWDIKA